MARTRAQRRRHNVIFTIALAVTIVVLLFARDVSRSAHGSTSLRLSENRSFGVMANTLLNQEGLFDARLSYLLTHGQTLTRQVFAARLGQLAGQLTLWSSEATLLRRPVLAHDVNTSLAQLTEQRVDDYEVVLDTIAASLRLPWTNLNVTGLAAVSAQSSLLATDQQWGLARWSLVKEPGRITLDATTTSSVIVTLSTELANLRSAPSMTLIRGIGIVAVSVSPAPLPAPAGEILLPPVGLVHLGVSVTNVAFTDQPVALTVVFSPTHPPGPNQVSRMTATLGPLQSFAFVPKLLATAPSEEATLRISIGGAPAAPSLAQTRIYHVKMSPSGNG